MKAAEQIPRNALVWMIASMFTLVLPHVGRLPPWILVLFALAALWRAMVYQGRWSFPGKLAKLVLIAGGFAGILLSYGNLLGLEPTVALLLTAFAFKLVECSSRKDAYVVLFLGYFICVTEFLFTQDLLIVAYSCFNVLLVTTALVAMQQERGVQRFGLSSMRQAGIMLAQAVPLMIVLFFLFPRIGPLWTVPIKSHSAKTGVSDFMRPGDISNLSRTGDVAFRVQFQGEIPPQQDLYWRGLVMSKIERGAWRSLSYFEVPAENRRQQEPVLDGEALEYSIIIEPTQQHWLYGLRYARSAGQRLPQMADYTLYTPVEIENRYQYRVRSWPAADLELELSEWRRKTELALPPRGNDQTRQLAQALYAQADSDAAYVERVLAMFREQPFVYTLQPPLLGDQAMDDFLFNTRRGFCEHYAAAFTYLMRAAGVPARVVAGYQGGEINPLNRTVIVHQFDAHAWSEVWLPDRGWVRIDPTAAVAPDRIELGLEQALAGEGSFLSDAPLSPVRFRGISWVNSLRLRYDALTYRWQSWVTGFDSESQYDILSDWLGGVDGRRFALLILGAGVLVLLPVAASLLRKPKEQPLRPVDAIYLRLCAKLAGWGYLREPGETPLDFASRIGGLNPALADPLLSVTQQYQRLAYAPEPGVADVAALARAVKRLRRR